MFAGIVVPNPIAAVGLKTPVNGGVPTEKFFVPAELTIVFTMLSPDNPC
jgi:hypothetical protein